MVSWATFRGGQLANFSAEGRTYETSRLEIAGSVIFPGLWLCSAGHKPGREKERRVRVLFFSRPFDSILHPAQFFRLPHYVRRGTLAQCDAFNEEYLLKKIPAKTAKCQS